MLLELLSTVLIKGYSHLCGSVGNLIVVEITIELLLVECCHHVMYLSCRSLSVALYSTRTLYCIVLYCIFSIASLLLMQFPLGANSHITHN